MSQPGFAHRWSPITDLPTAHGELSRSDLKHLRDVWLEQKAELEAHEAVQDFNTRLLRRWAIETGLIERLYTLDRGITELLVERGLDAGLVPHGSTNGDPEHVISMIRDQHNAVTGLFDFVKSRRELGTSYVKELHSVLTANQSHADAVDPQGRRVKVPLRRGEYKQRPNNPREIDGRVHEYCPPEQVASEMDRLIEMYRRHQSIDVAPEVQAAWLHHRFTQIHPFEDGNGRVARTLATLVLLKSSGFPLVVTNDQRDVYRDALRAADGGTLRPLVKLFAKIERHAFVQALGAAAQAKQDVQRLDAVIAVMRDTFEKRREVLSKEWAQAKELSGTLQEMAKEKLDRLAQKLNSELAPSVPFTCFADRNHADDEKSHWFRYQIFETAKTLGYFANPGSYHAWARLVLETTARPEPHVPHVTGKPVDRHIYTAKLMAETTARSEILLSLHGLGHDFRGVVVGSVCIYEKDPKGDFVIPASNIVPLTEEPFQVNYKETKEAVADGFSDWFDQALVKGLATAIKLL